MFSSKKTCFVGLVLCVVFGASLAQLAAPPTEAELLARGAKPLGTEQLQALLKNQTLYHSNLTTGQTFPMFYRDDGQRFLKFGSTVRSTKWWIKDSQRCEDSIGRAGSVCQKHFQDADVLRVCGDGDKTCNWVVTVSPGDAEGIGK